MPDPGAVAPSGVPLPAGQDETLGSKGDQVKSGCIELGSLPLAWADRPRIARGADASGMPAASRLAIGTCEEDHDAASGTAAARR